MGISLHDAMMAIKHPANPNFLLFHLIDHHWKDDCYIVTCLKSADSLAHAMIAALLPYIKWTLEAWHGKVATSQVPKWFKPSAHIWADDTYWDPKEECIQNKSKKMLNQVISNNDRLYWEIDVVDPIPAKQKKIKVDDKFITDSVSTVKTAISSVQTCHTTVTCTQNAVKTMQATKAGTSDTQTVTSQMLMITQLTERVSIFQLAHNEINSKLNKLAEFIMVQSASNKTPSPSKRKAARGLCRSPSKASWWPTAASRVHGSNTPSRASQWEENPLSTDPTQAWMSQSTTMDLITYNGEPSWKKPHGTICVVLQSVDGIPK